MYLFNQEKHRKLWLLLSEHIAEAAKENYAGTGYYSAYSELEKLKRKLLQDFFEEDDRIIRNLCFACNAAMEEQQSDWFDYDAELDCRFCPLNWPDGLYCDDRHSLYTQLVDLLHKNDIEGAAAICITIANVTSFTDEEYLKQIPRQTCRW